jgi:hypothetical protein
MGKLLMKWENGHELISLSFRGTTEPSEIWTEQLLDDERVEYRVSVKPEGENLYVLQYIESEQTPPTQERNQFWGRLALTFSGKEPAAYWREDGGFECDVECLELDDSVQLPGTELLESADPGETERKQLAKTRLKQWVFRAQVMVVEWKGCRVTRVADFRFLVASHMIGWADCLKAAADPASGRADQIDGNNGLLLSPHIDKLFDKYLISFTDDGNLLYSDDVKLILTLWKIDLSNLPPARDFKPGQLRFIGHHRGEFEKRCRTAGLTPIPAKHSSSRK